MSESGDGFLQRWSRRKRQALAAPAAPVAPAAPAALAAPVTQDLPEEIPPPAETIPLDEIALWLNRRVPQAWRVLALRRLWVSDAAIAGFIGPADYQFDWEALGGSPGWGPLRAVDDITELLSRAIGTWPAPAPESAPESGPAMAAPVGLIADAAAERAVEDAAFAAPVGQEPDRAAPRDAADAPRRRRGGAATPV